MKDIIGRFLYLKENSEGSFASHYGKPLQLIFNLPTFVLRANGELPLTGQWSSETLADKTRLIYIKYKGGSIRCTFKEDLQNKQVILTEGDQYAVFNYR